MTFNIFKPLLHPALINVTLFISGTAFNPPLLVAQNAPACLMTNTMKCDNITPTSHTFKEIPIIHLCVFGRYSSEDGRRCVIDASARSRQMNECVAQKTDDCMCLFCDWLMSEYTGPAGWMIG